MAKRVVAIHTASPMIEPTRALFQEHLSDVHLNHIVDDSLIQEVIREGKVTPAVSRRLMSYYFAAVDAGADVIFNTCSSVGEVADFARPLLPIALVKIDDAMAEKAVLQAASIGVLATLPTTLGPTVRLLRSKAVRTNRKIQVVEGLAEGAFNALVGGDTERHDALILETAVRISRGIECLVLAQGSMARMQETLAFETGKTVLASPILGTLAVKAALEG